MKVCHKCGKYYSTKSILNTHLRTCIGTLDESEDISHNKDIGKDNDKVKLKLVRKEQQFISDCGVVYATQWGLTCHNKRCNTCIPIIKKRMKIQKENEVLMSTIGNQTTSTINTINSHNTTNNINNINNINIMNITVNDFSKQPSLADVDALKIKQALESGQWTSQMTKAIYIDNKEFCNVSIPHLFKDVVVVYTNKKVEYRFDSVETLNEMLGNLVDVTDEYLAENPNSVGKVYQRQHENLVKEIIKDNPDILKMCRKEIKGALITDRYTIKDNFKDVMGKEFK